MRLRLAIVTNQGVAVHAVAIPSKQYEEKIVLELCRQWGLTERKEFAIAGAPILYRAAIAHDVSVKRCHAWTDSKKSPRYTLVVVSAEVPDVINIESPKEWQFCPDCGCSWLSHLEGQASLDVGQWDPRPCSECGCKKALGS